MNALWRRVLAVAARAGVQWAITRLRAHDDAQRKPVRRRRSR